MIKQSLISSQDGIAMPISWNDVAAAAVRTLPAVGGVAAGAAAAATKGRSADAGHVRAYTPRVVDVFVLAGAFPGTSAWSPPI